MPADQPAAALRMLTMQMAGDVASATEQQQQQSTFGAAIAKAAESLLPQPWRRGSAQA